MDRFEKKLKKVRLIKNTGCDWLINYIPEPIRKSVSDFKDKFLNLFKASMPNQTVYGREMKLSKPSKQNIKENPSILEENKEKNKDRIIRDI